MKFDKQKAKRVNPEVDSFWTPEKAGDEVSGVYTNSFETQYGTCYCLEDGDKTIGLPSHTALLNQMSKLSIGSNVLVTFNGVRESDKGREYKDYTVLWY